MLTHVEIRQTLTQLLSEVKEKNQFVPRMA